MENYEDLKDDIKGLTEENNILKQGLEGYNKMRVIYEDLTYEFDKLKEENNNLKEENKNT